MPAGHRLPNLVDQTFGALTLKERIVEKVPQGTRISWVCECECGKVITRRQDIILKSKHPSCGCKHPNKRQTGSLSGLWTGCGDLPGYYVAMLRNSAKNRNMEFNLTSEYLWGLFVDQGGRCALSNLPLRFHEGSQRSRMRENHQTASLDRKNSSIGYIPGNVQWVHKTINQMKNHFTDDIFIMACNAVADTHPMQPDRSALDDTKGTRNAKTGRRLVTSPRNPSPASP